jgi:hypothetical protein
MAEKSLVMSLHMLSMVTRDITYVACLAWTVGIKTLSIFGVASVLIFSSIAEKNKYRRKHLKVCNRYKDIFGKERMK